jgi:Na+/H+ antiporter NhaD/arsenite permease-like protein
MEQIIPIVAMALVIVGLVGQGFDMRKIRNSIKTDEELNPKNAFADRRNIKWYVMIGAGLVLWYVAGGSFGQ